MQINTEIIPQLLGPFYPPIPPQCWIPLYGILISSIIGWSIPNIIGWARARIQIGMANQYHKRITSLSDNKLHENDIQTLDNLETQQLHIRKKR